MKTDDMNQCHCYCDPKRQNCSMVLIFLLIIYSNVSGGMLVAYSVLLYIFFYNINIDLYYPSIF